MTFGEQLKLDGMGRAEDAVPDWASEARLTIRLLARSGQEFTSEDVVAVVGLPRGETAQNRNSAVGAVMSGAARAGWIQHVGYRKAKRTVSHARVVQVWMGTGA